MTCSKTGPYSKELTIFSLTRGIMKEEEQEEARAKGKKMQLSRLEIWSGQFTMLTSWKW